MNVKDISFKFNQRSSSGHSNGGGGPMDDSSTVNEVGSFKVNIEKSAG